MTATQIPGYVVGTWSIDPVHSDVSFSVRHMMVSKVRGRFTEFSGSIVTGENPTDSSVSAEISLGSINTNNDQRDQHIRSADFFEVEKYPSMSFRSNSLEADGSDWTLTGDLNLHGVTKPVTLKLELNGFTKDPYGGTRVGLSAKTEIDRQDYGISIKTPMEGGGVVVGDKISIDLEIEAVLDQQT